MQLSSLLEVVFFAGVILLPFIGIGLKKWAEKSSDFSTAKTALIFAIGLWFTLITSISCKVFFDNTFLSIAVILVGIIVNGVITYKNMCKN